VRLVLLWGPFTWRFPGDRADRAGACGSADVAAILTAGDITNFGEAGRDAFDGRGRVARATARRCGAVTGNLGLASGGIDAFPRGGLSRCTARAGDGGDLGLLRVLMRRARTSRRWNTPTLMLEEPGAPGVLEPRARGPRRRRPGGLMICHTPPYDTRTPRTPHMNSARRSPGARPCGPCIRSAPARPFAGRGAHPRGVTRQSDRVGDTVVLKPGARSATARLIVAWVRGRRPVVSRPRLRSWTRRGAGDPRGHVFDAGRHRCLRATRAHVGESLRAHERAEGGHAVSPMPGHRSRGYGGRSLAAPPLAFRKHTDRRGGAPSVEIVRVARRRCSASFGAGA
jgi:hypothetical protein